MEEVGGKERDLQKNLYLWNEKGFFQGCQLGKVRELKICLKSQEKSGNLSRKWSSQGNVMEFESLYLLTMSLHIYSWLICFSFLGP